MPDSSASSSSARAGSVMTSPSSSRRTVPLEPRNDFSRRPSWVPPSSSSYVNSSAIAGARPGRRPTARGRRGRPAELVTLRVSASSIARWSVDLPASLGPRTTVSPGDELEVGVLVAADVPEGEARDPHSVTSWPASSSRPRRSTSRSSSASRTAIVSPVASRSAIRASTSRMNAPGIVSAAGSRPRSGPAGSRRGRGPCRKLALSAASTSSGVEVQLVRPDADEPDVEDEVRVRPGPGASR